MRFPAAIIAAGLLALPAPAFAEATISAAQIGQIFCIGRLANEMAPVRALLTPGLAATIAKAEAANDAIQKQHPGEKPPLGDGIPWQGFQDYAPECNVVGLTGGADTPQVVIAYTYPDQPKANWVDGVQLKFIDGKLRIDNVEYGNKGNLRQALVDAFK
jgi:hypothetical protein